MFYPLSFLLPILFYAALHVDALHFALNGKPTNSHFYKRDHISGLDNTQNILYYTNISLGGQPVSVSIDTGRQAIFFSVFQHLNFNPSLAPIYGFRVPF
jgi:hypothetical protein